jgi:hypothetical protein
MIFLIILCSRSQIQMHTKFSLILSGFPQYQGRVVDIPHGAIC